MRNEKSTGLDFIWLKDYELLIDLIRTEGDRFWARWNLSLVLGTALFAAFALLLPKEDLTFPRIVGPIIICFFGIASGYVWYRLTVSGEGWQLFYVRIAAKIEASHPELEKIFSDAENYERRFPVMKLAKIIPCVFTLVWSLLTLWSFFISLTIQLN